MQIEIVVDYEDGEYWWNVLWNGATIAVGSEKDKDLAWTKAIKKSRKELKRYM